MPKICPNYTQNKLKIFPRYAILTSKCPHLLNALRSEKVSVKIKDVSASVFVTGGAACRAAKVRPNQTEEADACFAVSLDRLQNIEEVIVVTRI